MRVDAIRRGAAAVAVAMLLSLLNLVLMTSGAQPAGANHVAPTPIPGASNVTCAQLAVDYLHDGVNEKKSDPPGNETLLIPGGSITITNYNGVSFNWTSSVRLDAVFVKSGSDKSNLYLYSPDSFGDTGLTTQDGSGISHISFCYDDSPTTTTSTTAGSTTTQPTSPSCPIPTGDGVVARVLNKGGYIYANRDLDGATTGPFSVALKAGVYDVYLTSWDSHSTRSPDPEQTQERYFVQGLFGGSVVWTSNSIDDLPDDKDVLTQLVNSNASIPALDQVGAFHTAYKSEPGNSLQPVCVVFVPKSDTTTTTEGTTTTTEGTTTTTEGTTTTTQGSTTTTQGSTTTTQGSTTTTQGSTTTTQGSTTTTAGPSVAPTTVITSALGDYVWFDENEDGRQGNPDVEFPILGATVQLLAPNGTVLATQVTGGDGLYLFDNLTAGTYRVRVCVAGADFTTTNAAGVADNVDSDVFESGADDGCATTALISLPAGITDLTWDAGILIDVRGIQVEPTTTTAAPPVTTIDTVSVDTLPFTGFEMESALFLAIGAMLAGSVLVLAMTKRRPDGAAEESTMSGWSNN